MTRLVVVDLDGTLIPGNSFHQWMRTLATFALRNVKPLLLLRLVVAAALRASRLTNHRSLKRAVLRLSGHLPASVAAEFGESLVTQIRPEVLAAVRTHAGPGIRVVLVSAAPDLYLAPVARHLDADSVVATPGVVTPGWQECVGEAKWSRLVDRYGQDARLDTVFTDHSDDLPLARHAKHTILVAPSESTRRAFRCSGRPIEEIGRSATVPHAVGAVMVTYNSELVAGRAVAALSEGTTPPEVIVIVDNGSRDTRYLDEIARQFSEVRLLKLPENLGFCAANNRGLALTGRRHLLLVNPDAFVSPTLVHDAVGVFDTDPTVGAVGPKLLGADATTGLATGLIDSAGIGQTKWGRLFDQFKGTPDAQCTMAAPMEPVALCAAAMLVRREAVEELTRGRELFDERFFMYKEDVELSWRLQRAGWRIIMHPAMTALHCRGWKDDRRAMPAWARRRSLANEWRLWSRGWTPGRSRWKSLPYLVAKTLAVGAGQ